MVPGEIVPSRECHTLQGIHEGILGGVLQGIFQGLPQGILQGIFRGILRWDPLGDPPGGSSGAPKGCSGNVPRVFSAGCGDVPEGGYKSNLIVMSRDYDFAD